MKRFLIEITRSTRAERPSEADIYNDSVAMTQGDFASVTQDVSKDNYFILSASSIQNAGLKLLARMQNNPAGLQAGNGFRIIEYPHSDRLTDSQALRNGSKAELHTYTNGGTSINTFDTLTEALQAITGLNASDGYMLLDEGVDTSVMASRPSLWNVYEVPEISQANTHGRDDTDRF